MLAPSASFSTCFYLIVAATFQQIVLLIHISLFFHFISFYVQTRDKDMTTTLCFVLVLQFYSQFVAVILLSAYQHTGEVHLLYRGTNFPYSVSILIIHSQFTYTTQRLRFCLFQKLIIREEDKETDVITIYFLLLFNPFGVVDVVAIAIVDQCCRRLSSSGSNLPV